MKKDLLNAQYLPPGGADTGGASVAQAVADHRSEAVHRASGLCRICLDGAPASDLIAPCLCRGTQLWVHRDCLDEWRATGRGAFSQCGECCTPYILVPPKDTARSQLLRRVKFISLFGLESGGFFVVVQIIIALCGGLVALLDRASSVCFIKGLRFWDHDVECWCPNDGAPTPTAAPTSYPLDPTDAPQPECVSGSLLVEGVLPPFMRGTNAAGLVADYYLLGVVLFFFAIGLFSCCAGGCTKFCGKKKKNAGAETSAAQLLE